MKSLTLVILLATSAYANICTTAAGHWSFEIAAGVTDFSTLGVSLNNKYFCFFGCLVTQTAVQNYKVDLANGTMKLEKPLDVEARKLQLLKHAASPSNKDDPNEEFCPDPVLRQEVSDAISKATQNTAKSIAQALLYNLNKPGWAIVVVQLANGGFVMNSVYQDWNFCDYDAVRGTDFYNVKVAKIDMS